MAWDYVRDTDPADEPIPDEWVWERLRIERDAKLVSSDWTQVADAVVDQAAWADYRQSLRDLPASTTDPREAVWPTAPTV